MVIYGMDSFQRICKEKLVNWYNNSNFSYRGPNPEDRVYITERNVYVVWSCKTLQNYKALLSTNINGDGIYVEYTFNGDKGELYQDVYEKVNNTCYKE